MSLALMGELCSSPSFTRASPYEVAANYDLTTRPPHTRWPRFGPPTRTSSYEVAAIYGCPRVPHSVRPRFRTVHAGPPYGWAAEHADNATSSYEVVAIFRQPSPPPHTRWRRFMSTRAPHTGGPRSTPTTRPPHTRWSRFAPRSVNKFQAILIGNSDRK